MSKLIDKKDARVLLGGLALAVVFVAVVVLGAGLVTHLLVNALLSEPASLSYGKSVVLTVLGFWTAAVLGAGARASK